MLHMNAYMFDVFGSNNHEEIVEESESDKRKCVNDEQLFYLLALYFHWK